MPDLHREGVQGDRDPVALLAGDVLQEPRDALGQEESKFILTCKSVNE